MTFAKLLRARCEPNNQTIDKNTEHDLGSRCSIRRKQCSLSFPPFNVILSMLTFICTLLLLRTNALSSRGDAVSAGSQTIGDQKEVSKNELAYKNSFMMIEESVNPCIPTRNVNDDADEAGSHEEILEATGLFKSADVSSEIVDDKFGLKYQQEKNNENTEQTIQNNGDKNEPCIDLNERCPEWAEHGECAANPKYMLVHCRKSCTCFDIDVDMGIEQIIDDDKTREIVRGSQSYLRKEILNDSNFECKNRDELCAFWAASGECETNPNYMLKDCAPSCQSCEMIDMIVRCPLDPNAIDAIYPGDINKIFKRVVGEDSKYVKYKPVVLSRPSLNPNDEGETLDYGIGPWIVTFESFLTDEECDHLIALGTEQGYERSLGVGKLNPDGSNVGVVSDTRTCENAWCVDQCYNDPITKRILDRIVDLTGIPETNQEHLQLLKYDVDQFYGVHHDYLRHHPRRQEGPRVLTLFLYLNDVDKGGETKFSDLNIAVMPKKGKAVLWPNVMDKNPKEKDFCTRHEAMPVLEGVKYAANAWIHIHDFKTPWEESCQ